jgi:hypothetical protein
LNTLPNHEGDLGHLSSKLTYGKEEINWRRSKVLELSSQGYSQHEIAIHLQIANGTVNSDLTYLKKQAADSLQKHIHENIPQEYQQSLTGINQVLKMALGIATQDIDNKTNLALINDCNKYKMDLATGSAICNEAINFVTQRKEQLNKLETLQKVKE